MIDYLKMFERSANLSRIRVEIQGVYREPTDGTIRFHTYVVRE